MKISLAALEKNTRNNLGILLCRVQCNDLELLNESMWQVSTFSTNTRASSKGHCFLFDFCHQLPCTQGCRGCWSLSQLSGTEEGRVTPWTYQSCSAGPQRKNTHLHWHFGQFMTLDSGRRPECPGRACTHTETACKFHIERAQEENRKQQCKVWVVITYYFFLALFDSVN